MFEKLGWKLQKKPQSPKKRKRKVKTPPPGFSILLGQKDLPNNAKEVLLILYEREDRSFLDFLLNIQLKL